MTSPGVLDAENTTEPFTIGDWRIDPESNSIARGEEELRLEPKAMQVLVLLATRAGHVVTRSELEESVWADMVVGPDALTNTIIKLRRALSDDARSPQFIETIPKTGYRLIAPVRTAAENETGPALAFDPSAQNATRRFYSIPTTALLIASLMVVASGALVFFLQPEFWPKKTSVERLGSTVLAWFQTSVPREEPASIERLAFPLPDKPSIAVLPFDNLSDDPKQEFLSDGLTNDIITDLSKYGSLFVIASNSSFTYKGKAVKVQQVAEELGVHYVLEGSMQRAGENLRINAQLIDATTGRHLWAERYDQRASDFFVIREDILQTIVASLAFQLKEVEVKRALGKDTESLRAYDYYQQAWKLFFTFTKEGNNQALELLEKAIDLDPDYARAYGLLSWVHVNNSSGRYSWGENPERSMELSLETAHKAVELDPDDYYSQWSFGYAQMNQGNYGRANAAYERALALNPSDANLLANMAELLYKSRRAEQAIAQIKLAMRINPHHPDWYLWDLGLAQYIAGEYREALDTLNRMSYPSNGVRRIRAAVLVRLGRLEEAREVISKFIETDIDTTLEEMEDFPWESRIGLDRWIDDLRTAGLPEKRPPPLQKSSQ